MSTIRVNTIQSTSTTDGGISIDSSGHVTLDGQSLPSAGPLSNRNLIINGAMQVAQRGTSQTNQGYGSVDRFYTVFNGGAMTTSQESLTSGDPYDAGFRNFVRLANTTAASSAAHYRRLIQLIEAQNLTNSGWNYASATSYVTLSFWVRSSVSQEGPRVFTSVLPEALRRCPFQPVIDQPRLTRKIPSASMPAPIPRPIEIPSPSSR